MVGDKGKKLKVGERGEDENAEHIDRDLVLSIEKLQKIQEELEKINEEASDKVLEVEQKYNEIRKPIYEKRNDIIKLIPDLWLTAFMSHPAFLLTEEDQKIFKYLSSLEVEDFKDLKSGYSITFNFKPNPYFEDTKLTKTFTFLDEETTKISATPIKWKDGKGIPDGVAREKNGSKRSHAEESFFSWFSDIDDIQDEVAELIKEDLWTNPLNFIKFFSNDSDEEAFDEEEDDEEEDDDDDDEEGEIELLP
ncbi:NAP1-related protein 2-like [Actinidia eriantha]|uniref:NAP1-related protein 2-like n=1 Tax=Actinidia eriantha TaxID=165200 RepID=UPI002588F860|nr:NAP1-related protein 2-like [Actinidia eriantha]XP_057474734.1 NAP1-related protein 2-like [Actinidia eriantha]